MPAKASSDILTDAIVSVRTQLRPYGYCGHLLSFLESKKTHLEDVIKRTALMSESNSMLIIGPTGSGKSALLEHVLGQVFKNKGLKENMLQVRLDGLIHINDNLALEDITRQLGLREMEDKSIGSFSEKLRLILSALKSGTKESKSVLFVLDNFDLFCTHKNQNLLYNLFDIAQSQQNPICVIGMCSQPNVLQALENRVNSRFSHQKLLLLDELKSEEYHNSAQDFLTLHDFHDLKFQKQWNANLQELFKNKLLKTILDNQFRCSNSLRDLKALLSLSLQNVCDSHPKITIEDFQSAVDYSNEDEKAVLMLGLSVLEVALLVAMMHLTEIYDGEPFNFEIVFNELGRFLRNRMKWNIDKPIVMKAFEHLLDLELVKATTESSANVVKRYMLVKLLVTNRQVRDVIEKYQNLPMQLKHWTESSYD